MNILILLAKEVHIINKPSQLKHQILAVIPARKDNIGIPQRNKLVLENIPLIIHIINKAQQVSYLNDICVTTDDREVISYAKYLGVDYIERNPELCRADVPLAPVLKNAVEIMEQRKNKQYDIILLMSPTCPTLKIQTIYSSIEQFLSDDVYDTYISAKKVQSLLWFEENGNFKLFQHKRIISDIIKPFFLETGAFFILKRENITEKSILGKNPRIIVLDDEQAIQVKDKISFAHSEAIISRKKIMICTIGTNKHGLGHIFRTLTLARWLSKHDIIFITTKDNGLAKKFIIDYRYDHQILNDWIDIEKTLIKYSPDIIINDVLDTSLNFMQIIDNFKNNQDKKIVIINFEDLGKGTKLADIVINALYETTVAKPNHYFGYKYVCIPDMFRYLPVREIESVKRILITFGGTDPGDLYFKITPLLTDVIVKNKWDTSVTVLAGPGIEPEKVARIKKMINELKENSLNITFKHFVPEMALEMIENDLIISSNGRTVYEAIALGIPIVCFSQNEREDMHLFSKFAPCVSYMGRYSDEKNDDFKEVIASLIGDNDIIREKNQEAIHFGNDIRHGIKRIINLIEKGV